MGFPRRHRARVELVPPDKSNQNLAGSGGVEAVKKTLRWLWVSITLVTLLLVIAIGFTPAGSRLFAESFETYIKAKSNTPIEIDGGMFVSHFFSKPTVGIRGIRLYESAETQDTEAPLLTAKRFEVRVAPQLPSSETGLLRVSDVVFSEAELVVQANDEEGIDLSALRSSWVALINSSPQYVELVDIGQIRFEDLKIIFERSSEYDPIEVHVPTLTYDMDESAIAVHLIPEGDTELVKIKFYEEGVDGPSDMLKFRAPSPA